MARNKILKQAIRREEWRPVALMPYEVSSYGRVRRIPGLTINKLVVTHRGYARADLSSAGKRKSVFVHSLVAAAFIGPRPEGKVINHKNGRKRLNFSWNLEYLTPKENSRHAIASGIHVGRFFGSKDKKPRVRRWWRKPAVL